MDPLDHVRSKTRRAYDLAARRYHDLFHDELKDKPYDRGLLDAFAARFPRGALVCDAGCGPAAQIGRYLADKGLSVIGVDISERCVEMAAAFNSDLRVRREDIGSLSSGDGSYDGIVAYYSIIHTPKAAVGRLFREFHRVLKPDGGLLVAVKAGVNEGYVQEIIGIQAEIYFSLFNEREIRDYFEKAGFAVEFIERRDPYDWEINTERIFGLGRKIAEHGGLRP